MKFNGKMIGVLILCAAAGVGLTAAALNTDIFGLAFFSALLPLPLIFIRAVYGAPALLISLFALSATAYLIRGINYAVIYFIIVAIISFACGYAVISQKSFYDSELICCVSCAAAFVAVMLFIWVISGQTIIEAAVTKTRSLLSELPEGTLKVLYRYTSLSAAGNTTDLASLNAESVLSIPYDTALNGLMRYMTPALTLTVPQMCSVGVLLGGLFYYIIPRAILKRLKYRVAQIPVFSMWCLPKHFGIWSVIIYLIALIGFNAGFANFDIVYGIIYGAFNVVYTIQGLAFVDWLLLKKINGAGVRILILAVTYLLVSAIDLYMWIGLFDQLLKVRKRAPFNYEDMGN